MNLNKEQVLTVTGLKDIYKQWEEDRLARKGPYVGAEGLLKWYNTFDGKQRTVSIDVQLEYAEQRKQIIKEDGLPELFTWLDEDFDGEENRYNQYAYKQEEVWIQHKFPYDFITQPPLSYYKEHKDYKVKAK